MKPAKPTVSSLIDTDPIYRAIVKAVGYGQKTCKEVIEAIKGVTEKHGQEAVAEASKELLDYEAAAGDRWCKIKPELHNACRMLLGPTPAEWPSWYVNADGSPRKGRPAVWPPVLPGPPHQEETGFATHTKPDLLAAHAERQLRTRKYARRPAGKQAKEDLTRIEEEFRRRGIPLPPPESIATAWRPALPAEQEALVTLTEAELNERLQAARLRFNSHSPSSKAEKEASHQIDLLTNEYRSRGLTIPVLRTSEEPPKKPKRTKKKSA